MFLSSLLALLALYWVPCVPKPPLTREQNLKPQVLRYDRLGVDDLELRYPFEDATQATQTRRSKICKCGVVLNASLNIQSSKARRCAPPRATPKQAGMPKPGSSCPLQLTQVRHAVPARRCRLAAGSTAAAAATGPKGRGRVQQRGRHDEH